ncbi:DUF6686 family protein [Mangrovibacterium diazotrophicum]|uniref:Uncharacterized protein n=1 Tax=Mangrovibacterium diazotrophicum TaxID=1261403 RepID=A0A419W8S2_9BACT|nr:DUF6686 family protein [Mangrovibacterium diazotrophicum]RKD91840.1 hypothetical protein BC643_2208 [Mangrovibacterium diazotrophicum]
MIEGRGELIINQTINGRIYKCSECNKIHVDYKNLNFSFNQKEYNNFQTYIQNLDGKYWVKKNEDHSGERKILIPINHPNLIMSFSLEELYELKELLVANLFPPQKLRLIKPRTVELHISKN